MNFSNSNGERLQPRTTTLLRAGLVATDRLTAEIAQMDEGPQVNPESLLLANAQVPDEKLTCPNPNCYDRQKFIAQLAQITGLTPKALAGAIPRVSRDPGVASTTLTELVAIIEGLLNHSLTDTESDLVDVAWQQRGKKQLSRSKKFCTECTLPYNFEPAFKPGQVINGQYKVLGVLAYGGMGWIYLALDITLQRYVVLKGLLNQHDEEAALLAVQERQFLTQIDHPTIVRIYNVISTGTSSFIAMEYVGGTSLATLLEKNGPLPVEEAIRYILALLPAFSHLHTRGILYCDLKPGNIMIDRGQVRLIDMGGACRKEQHDGPIFGTVGFVAPEAGEHPSVESDIYTIARTLAASICKFEIGGRYLYSLPSAADEPLFAAHASLRLLLARATRQEPLKRFHSIEEFAAQLLGVYREITCQTSGPCQLESTIFGDIEPVYHRERPYLMLPSLKFDLGDPAAQQFLSGSSGGGNTNQRSLYEAARKSHPNSQEIRFRLAHSFAIANDLSGAKRLLDEAQSQSPDDWRLLWYGGILSMASADWAQALSKFELLRAELPGELAVLFAEAIAKERCSADALSIYTRILNTDRNAVAAIFGMADCCMRKGDKRKAINLLLTVPAHVSSCSQSRKQALDLLLDGSPTQEDLGLAESLLQEIDLAEMQRLQLQVKIVEMAVSALHEGSVKSAADVVLFQERFTERGQRVAAERLLRSLAGFYSGGAKVDLIDRANAIRPWSLF